MYQENNVKIDKTTAGLLCSAIISDTLLFRSPTCTAVDKEAALALAEIAGIHAEEYAKKMFAAGSNLKGKSDEDIFYQDFKRFTVGNSVFGIGQITSLDSEELENLKPRMLAYTEKAREQHDADMMFFMLTNILTESTDLICVGQGAEQLCFHGLPIWQMRMAPETRRWKRWTASSAFRAWFPERSSWPPRS